MTGLTGEASKSSSNCRHVLGARSASRLLRMASLALDTGFSCRCAGLDVDGEEVEDEASQGLCLLLTDLYRAPCCAAPSLTTRSLTTCAPPRCPSTPSTQSLFSPKKETSGGSLGRRRGRRSFQATAAPHRGAAGRRLRRRLRPSRAARPCAALTEPNHRCPLGQEQNCLPPPPQRLSRCRLQPIHREKSPTCCLLFSAGAEEAAGACLWRVAV